MRAVSHPNILKLQEVFEDEFAIYLVMDRAKESVLTVLNRRRSFTEQQVAKITYQLLSGLSNLHNMGIMHRDIKLGNILRTLDDRIVLADLGSSVKAQEST